MVRSGMVPVPSKNGSVCICVDLARLNEAVCRKEYTLPSVQQTLRSLARAHLFSKLDANRGFWQILLSPESARYTMYRHMDVVLMWGKDQDEHDNRLHAVLHKLQVTDVTLNMEKCELSRDKVKFLGHILSAEGVQPYPDKTKAIRDMKESSNIGEVRSFLGMVHQLVVVPATMCNSVLKTLHEGHQGRTRCREQAKDTVRRPGLSSQLNY